MHKKLVIFDLDGTLLNTIADIAYAANVVLERHHFPTHTIDAYRQMVGNGIRKLMERAIPEAERTEMFVSQMRDEFADVYQHHCMVDTVIYPGIVELLTSLQQCNIAVAVASNKFHDATVSIIAHYFPEIQFLAVVGHRDGKPTKPAPDIVFDIIGGRFLLEEVLYVGDSGVDMLTAHNAGVDSVGVTWGFRTREELREYGAKHLVDKPSETLNFCCPVTLNNTSFGCKTKQY
ncbi:MAG: HAD family hydrolase [Bacteroidales bacterium]|nr:HAD family hydrolase [Bacteroidales bacterium]